MRRVGKRLKTFRATKERGNIRSVSMYVEKELFELLVIQAATYGAEAWVKRGKSKKIIS